MREEGTWWVEEWGKWGGPTGVRGGEDSLMNGSPLAELPITGWCFFYASYVRLWMDKVFNPLHTEWFVCSASAAWGWWNDRERLAGRAALLRRTQFQGSWILKAFGLISRTKPTQWGGADVAFLWPGMFCLWAKAGTVSVTESLLLYCVFQDCCLFSKGLA
jgi:hypothetical protein